MQVSDRQAKQGRTVIAIAIIPANNLSPCPVPVPPDGAFTVDGSVDSTSGRVFVNGGATLNITGGNHSSDISNASRYDFVGTNSVGVINQSAGLNNIGHGLRIGTGNANSDVTYNLTGGDLLVSRAANSVLDPDPPGGRPSLEVGGLIAGGQGTLEISGGSLETRAATHLLGTGTFSILGSAATTIGIGTNNSLDGVWLQKAGGTLSAQIDAGGVTPIFVADNSGGQIYAEFESGSILDLGFLVPEASGTWTILEAENTAITNSGLALSAGTASGWSFNVDNTGTNGLLTATFVAVMIGPR